MSAIRNWLAVSTLCFHAGCAYHGAVYSEYTQFALDVRSTAQSSAPIKVGLGYDRGTMAYVPKLEGKSGESCAIISWQDIGSVAAPTATGTSSVLRVEGGFISGTAAIVAAAPAESEVVIQPSLETKGQRLRYTTKGGPGERIAAALTPMKFGQDANTTTIRAWLKVEPANTQKLKEWIQEHHLEQFGTTHILNDEAFAKTRQMIVDELVKKP